MSSQPAEPGAVARQQDSSGPTASRRGYGVEAVLVGVDSSDASRAAIALAAREARYRGAPLIAVQAYSGERPPAAPAARPLSIMRTPEDERVDAESNLREAVRAVLGDQADGVELRAVLGLAGRKIVETAQKVNAQLIVLATRGSTSMLLGTVSQYVLRKAPCPVLVVPAGSPTARPMTA
jgi:nucleotide-binding universal stress UspA family protein